MSKIKLIHGDALKHSVTADMILTDPPFDMSVSKLCNIILNQDSKHLLLITTMRQLLDLHPLLGWKLSFDFVLDSVAPKKSNSKQQPNYTHNTGVYLHHPDVKSLFNRKLRQRSDVFEGNGYWPTIFHAPRERAQVHGMAKNTDAITDLLGSFDVQSVVDPFAGSGTTGIAAFELDIDCTLIELSETNCSTIRQTFSFFGMKV